MSKKRVGLSMVRNESDVIETFIRHNLTLLDELHIVDHNSSDNTREILIHLKQRDYQFISIITMNLNLLLNAY